MDSNVSLNTNTFKVKNLRWWIVAVNSLILIVNYADRTAIGIGAPYIMKEFGFSTAQWGVILGAFAFGYAPFCFVGGWASDKFGPRKIMAIAAVWWSAFTALTALGFNFISFIILRILFGMGEGPFGAVTTKTMGNWFPQRELGKAIAIPNACTPLGGAIATPVVAYMIIAFGDWRAPFIILGVLGLLFALGWYVVVRDKPDGHPWITKEEIALISGGDMARRPEFAADGTVPKISEYVKKPIILSTSFCFFGYAWVMYTFLSWFPVYLFQARGLDMKAIAITAAIPWIAGAIGQALGGITTDWLGKKFGNPAKMRKWFIVFCLVVSGLTFAPCAMVTSLNHAIILMTVSIFMLYMAGPNHFVIIAENVPSSRLGGVTGFVHLIANLSGILAPIVTGLVVSTSGNWLWGFGIGAIVMGVGALGLAIFGKMEQA